MTLAARRAVALAAASLALGGCVAPEQAADDGWDGPRVPADLLALDVEEGARDRFAADPFVLDFDAQPAALAVELLDDAGDPAPVEGRWVTGTRYLASPLAPLPPSAEHTLLVSWRDDGEPREATRTFTTSDRLAKPLSGRPDASFVFDLRSSEVLSPAAGEPLLALASLVLLRDTKLEPDGALRGIATFAELRGGRPRQGPCSPTFQFDASEPTAYANPWFSSGPVTVGATIPLPLLGPTPIVLRDLRMSGAYVANADGAVAGIDEVSYSALIDVRDAGLGDSCVQLGLVVPGLSCEPCPDDGVAQCLFVHGRGGVAPLHKGAALVPVDPQEAADCDDP